MAKGRKTGGRAPGTPNRITSAQREAWLLTFTNLQPDIETWIRQVANGWDEEVVVHRKGQEPVTMIKRVGKDPGRAAEIVQALAEYHVPKLARHEHTGEDGGPVRVIKVDMGD